MARLRFTALKLNIGHDQRTIAIGYDIESLVIRLPNKVGRWAMGPRARSKGVICTAPNDASGARNGLLSRFWDAVLEIARYNVGTSYYDQIKP